MDTGVGYYACLLRLWRVQGPGPGDWHAALEDAHTGERTGFPNLDTLFAYLRQLTNDQTISDRVESSMPEESGIGPLPDYRTGPEH